MTRGVLIYAFGEPKFGILAFNLALSIKINDPNANITCLHSENAMNSVSGEKLKYFDQLIKLPISALTYDGKKDYFRAKLDVYENSPYDETLYLDADMFWHEGKRISELMNICAQWDYTMQIDRIVNLQDSLAVREFNSWANGETYKQKYNFPEAGKLLNVGSYFIFFKKNGRFKELTAETINLYNADKNAASYRENQIADEHYWIAAMGKTQMNPGPSENWQTFMPIAHQHYVNWKKTNKWWGSTFPGTRESSVIKEYYQKHMSYYYRLANLEKRKEFFDFQK